MNSRGHILVINPGSTSTKLAIYTFELALRSMKLKQQTSIDHTSDDSIKDVSISDQFQPRLEAVELFLETEKIVPQLIMARGAPLEPIEGGVYAVNKIMLDEIVSGQHASHASNLAAMIGNKIANDLGIPVYIADPITTDEFEPLARISGVPGIVRKSRSHTLNIKASTRIICRRQNIDFSQSNWVVSHMGGGISVAAVRHGQIIDVNDALLGMGPFGPERAGALPIAGLLDLVYDKHYQRDALEVLLSSNSGLQGYLGSSDLRIIEERIAGGDEEADLIYSAMVYQISKEISAMASVLSFQLEGIVLTGGMAHSSRLCESISARIKTLAPVFIQAGENELQALADAGFRVLLGEAPLKVYNPGNL